MCDATIIAINATDNVFGYIVSNKQILPSMCSQIRTIILLIIIYGGRKFKSNRLRCLAWAKLID